MKDSSPCVCVLAMWRYIEWNVYFVFININDGVRFTFIEFGFTDSIWLILVAVILNRFTSLSEGEYSIDKGFKWNVAINLFLLLVWSRFQTKHPSSSSTEEMNE